MRTTLLALGLTLSLTACGGGGGPTALTDDGYAALGKGDSSTALSKFEDALETLPETDANYMRAKMGQIQALISSDAEKAKSEFLALAQSKELGAREYRTVGAKMTGEKAFEEAVAVLDAGFKKFPDDATLEQMIQTVAEEAKKAGATDALNSLSGLGYIGD